MPNPDQIARGKVLREQADILKVEYQKLKGNAVMTDLLAELTIRYDADYALAISETDNPHKSASALQRARAYDIIRAYITEKMM